MLSASNTKRGNDTAILLKLSWKVNVPFLDDSIVSVKSLGYKLSDQPLLQ